ncbi:MAG: hypothetical protein IKO77_00030 [Bacteroidales bacterium]|nr:hypothetical protein [Bacteroidales bacterium]
MRRAGLIILLLTLALNAGAQSAVTRPLRSIDSLIRSSRISGAGRYHFEDPFCEPEQMPRIPLTLSSDRACWSASQDLDFVRYLIESDLTPDAAALLSSGRYFPSDTLDYLCGTVLFTLKDLAAAGEYFSRVGESSPWYDESLFYAVVCDSHLKQFERGANRLQSYSGQMQEIASLQKAGIALLEDDPQAYLASAAGFSLEDFRLKEAEETLQHIYDERYLKPRKSPVVAGLMSAIIPGSGKIYAGYTGEGIASLLSVGTMAAVTAENWVKYGPRNWKTILFGSLTGVFYIANIYGSCVSVSLYYDELQNAQNATVLYHIHIPLRKFFR